MATSKKANFSADQIATLKAGYTGDNSVIALTLLAESVGKTVPSIRAKMSAEGFYKPNEKAASTSTRVKKSDTVERISKLVGGLSDADMEGLAKSTANPLARVLVMLTNQQKIIESGSVEKADDETAASEAEKMADFAAEAEANEDAMQAQENA